jgi:hypothetical protein
MVWQLCRRVWHRWLDVAVFSGALDLPGYDRDRRDWAACAWLPPKWDWVDPLKDARAEIEQIDAGLKSRTQALAERGYDAEQVDAEIAADRVREKGKRAAIDLGGRDASGIELAPAHERTGAERAELELLGCVSASRLLDDADHDGRCIGPVRRQEGQDAEGGVDRIVKKCCVFHCNHRERC